MGLSRPVMGLLTLTLFMTTEKVLELASDVYLSRDDRNAANYTQIRRCKRRNIPPIGEHQIFVFVAQELTILPQYDI
jgi:hypothetical protein